MTRPAPEVAAEVRAALEAGRAVVALETTLFVHGLPIDRSLQTARDVAAAIRDAGGVPAMIGVVDGRVEAGLSLETLARLLEAGDVPKVGLRDLPVVVARGLHGATTVAATAVIAHRAGIRVFATGGVGGVHRGARESWDVSGDLFALASTPLVVVCSGAKSILDIPATLEAIETLNLGLVGYRTDRFPGFYLQDGGAPVPWRAESPDEVARIARARDRLGLRGAIVVANPVPDEAALDPALHDRLVEAGLREATVRGITGKAVTPFLLAYLHRESGDASLRANVALARANARLAAEIAGAL